MESVNYRYFDESLLNRFINDRKSFEILGVGGSFKECILLIEQSIESKGLTCRVYTENRSAAIGAGLFAVGAGVFAAVGIAAHNLATYDPDYEIGKNLINNKVTVKFKK